MVLQLQEQRNTFGSFEFEWTWGRRGLRQSLREEEGGGPGLGLRRGARGRQSWPGARARTEEWVLGVWARPWIQTWALVVVGLLCSRLPSVAQLHVRITRCSVAGVSGHMSGGARWVPGALQPKEERQGRRWDRPGWPGEEARVEGEEAQDRDGVGAGTRRGLLPRLAFAGSSHPARQ